MKISHTANISFFIRDYLSNSLSLSLFFCTAANLEIHAARSGRESTYRSLTSAFPRRQADAS